jgi:tryptophan-rich sensory protein
MMPIFSLLFALILYIFMIVMNVLANSLPLGGINTGQVSFNYPNLFQPTGLTFSIWGVIYILLGVYLVYQFQLFFSSGISLTDQKINFIFGLTSLINSVWLLFWHYDKIGLSTIAMVFLLILLGLIVFMYPSLSQITRIAFSIYFGWISVALIANITIYLVKIGVPSFGSISILMTVLILIVGLVIGCFMILLKRNYVYGLVFVWAYFGITLRQTNKLEFNSEYPLIYITSILSLIILLGTSLFVLFKD